MYFLGVKAAGAEGWKPYHHPVPLSWNLGTLTSWNPLGHSRPVTGLLYFTFTFPKYLSHGRSASDVGRNACRTSYAVSPIVLRLISQIWTCIQSLIQNDLHVDRRTDGLAEITKWFYYFPLQSHQNPKLFCKLTLGRAFAWRRLRRPDWTLYWCLYYVIRSSTQINITVALRLTSTVVVPCFHPFETPKIILYFNTITQKMKRRIKLRK